MLISRVANYYQDQDRFLGFGFISISYYAPMVDFDLDTLNAHQHKVAGYPVFGYWKFFLADDAPQVLQEHVRLPFLSSLCAICLSTLSSSTRSLAFCMQQIPISGAQSFVLLTP